MELDEFKQISRLVNVGDDLWDLYADLLERKQSMYIRRCVGVNKDQALLDGYKEFMKVLEGDKSPRVFVKDMTQDPGN